jgi:hypothetical protein
MLRHFLDLFEVLGELNGFLLFVLAHESEFILEIHGCHRLNLFLVELIPMILVLLVSSHLNLL